MHSLGLLLTTLCDKKHVASLSLSHPYIVLKHTHLSMKCAKVVMKWEKYLYAASHTHVHTLDTLFVELLKCD